MDTTVSEAKASNPIETEPKRELELRLTLLIETLGARGFDVLFKAWSDLLIALADTNRDRLKQLMEWSVRSRKRHVQEMADLAFAEMALTLDAFSQHLEVPTNHFGQALCTLAESLTALSQEEEITNGRSGNYIKFLDRSIYLIYFPNAYNGLRAMGLGDVQTVKKIEEFLGFFEQIWEDKLSSCSDEKLNNAFKDIDEKLEATTAFIKTQYDAVSAYLLKINQDFLDHHDEKLAHGSATKWIRQQGAVKYPVSKARISRIAKEWQHRQVESIHRLHMHCQMLSIRLDLKEISLGIQQEIKQRFFDPLKKHIHILEKEISLIEEELEQGKLTEHPSPSLPNLPTEIGINVEEELEEVQAKVEAAQPLVKIVDRSSQEQFWKGETPQVQSKQIRFTEWINYLIKTHFQADIQKRLREIPSETENFYHELRDCVRLLTFSIGNKSEEELHIPQLQEVVKKSKKDLRHIEHELNQKQHEVHEFIDDQLRSTQHALNPKELQEVGAQFRRDLRESGGFKFVRFWQAWLRDTLSVQLRRLGILYGKTREDLAAADFAYATRKNQNPYAVLQDFVEQASPTPTILNALPFYYKELFIGSSDSPREHMDNRNRELQMAQNAIRRISQKIGGGILVIGHQGSGKTFFCENIAYNEIPGKVYKILPPIGGSTRAVDLKNALTEAVGKKGSPRSVLGSVPQGSVFVFDDIELWWERGENTYANIALLCEWIDQFSKDHFFICNCNLHFFEFVQPLHGLANHFISTIQLSPFSSEQVVKVILNRHYAGGLGLNIKGNSMDDASRRKVAKFLGRYHSVSNGNIGTALHAWLSNIESVENGEVSMREAKENYLPDVLSSDKLIQFTQIFLHKHIHHEKMKRMFLDMTEEEITHSLDEMYRSQLLVQEGTGIFSINPYVYFPLLRELESLHLL